MSHKKEPIVVLFFFITLILGASVSADFRIPGWYAVQDWELQVCSKWGGSETGQKATAKSDPVFLSQTTLTLAAERFSYPPDLKPESIYKVSWYFEPLLPAIYRIELHNPDGAKYVIQTDAPADLDSPGYAFRSVELLENFTTATIEFGAQVVEIPVVNITSV